MWYGICVKKIMRKRNRQTKNKKVGEDMLDQRDLEMIGELIRKETDGIKQDIQRLKENQDSFDRELNEIDITLRTEIPESIRLITENHMDLTDKVNRISKLEEEKVIMNLQLVRLQGELERTKIRMNV